MYETAFGLIGYGEVYSANRDSVLGMYETVHGSTYADIALMSCFESMMPYPQDTAREWLKRSGAAAPEIGAVSPVLPEKFQKMQKKAEKAADALFADPLKLSSSAEEKVRAFAGSYRTSFTRGDLREFAETYTASVCAALAPDVLITPYAWHIKAEFIRAAVKAGGTASNAEASADWSLSHGENSEDAAFAAMAAEISGNPEMLRMLSAVQTKEQFAQFMSAAGGTETVRLISDFAEKFGFIAPYSSKFESLTYCEDPKAIAAGILRRARTPLAVQGKEVPDIRIMQKKNVRALWEKLENLAAAEAQFSLCRRLAAGYMRYVYVDAGAHLEKEGLLQNRYSVFGLPCGDVFSNPPDGFGEKAENGMKEYNDNWPIPQFSEIISVR